MTDTTKESSFILDLEPMAFARVLKFAICDGACGHGGTQHMHVYRDDSNAMIVSETSPEVLKLMGDTPIRYFAALCFLNSQGEKVIQLVREMPDQSW